MDLYDFQERVFDLVSAGKSVILQAPTGAGKTRAALYPYLHSWQFQNHFPRKCIYSVPMRVLANQFEAEYAELAERYGFVEPLSVKIQTGDRPEDPELRGDLIFATIDQSLSSALAVPYSLSPGRANLNAGAFYSSYLIFDEFHLFPIAENGSAEGALITTLALLEQLKGIIPFVLMTATFSSTMLTELAQRLDAVVVAVSRAEYEKIASLGADRPRSRRFHLHEQSIAAEVVLATHQTRSVAICNQVQRSQALYEALLAHPALGDTRVELLHSRFLPKDRADKEIRIRREFGRDKNEHEAERLILVATQVVEVGLDITCEHLHTEIAPANAVLQRAGRCARYPGEQGHVHLYAAPLREARDDSPPKPDYLPYPAALCEQSWQSFRQRDNEVIDFETEQTIIDEVHTESDRALIANMGRQSRSVAQSIFEAMEQHERSRRAELIRQIDSITVLAATEAEALGNPFITEGFGLFRGSVYKLWRDLQEFAQEWEGEAFEEPPWLLKIPQVDERDAENPLATPTVSWLPVHDSSLLRGTNVVAINSAFVAYDAELGFRVVPPTAANGWASTPGAWPRSSRGGGFGYQLETYAEHITGMMRVYRREFAHDYAYAQRQLATLWNLPSNGLDRAVRLAIAGHDLAKLDERWQRWVRLYQQAIDDPLSDDHFMAVHTNYEPALFPHHQAASRATDRQLKRPPHAGESAAAVARAVVELAGSEPLARAVLTAIARHHSTGTDGYAAYDLHPDATRAFSEALAAAGLPASKTQPTLSTKRKQNDLSPAMIEPNDFQQQLLYLWVVRLLRLCDGLSQEERNRR